MQYEVAIRYINYGSRAKLNRFTLQEQESMLEGKDRASFQVGTTISVLIIDLIKRIVKSRMSYMDNGYSFYLACLQQWTSWQWAQANMVNMAGEHVFFQANDVEGTSNWDQPQNGEKSIFPMENQQERKTSPKTLDMDEIMIKSQSIKQVQSCQQQLVQRQPDFLESNQKDLLKIDIILQKAKARLEDVHSQPKSSRQAWTSREDRLLLELARESNLQWKLIMRQFPGRSHAMVYGRYRRLIKKPDSKWNQQDKEVLVDLVQKHGTNWKLIHQFLPNFTPKQLRERYENSLNPELNRESFSLEEDLQIITHVLTLGTTWKLLSLQMKGRSEGWLKGRYYNRLEKILKEVKEEIEGKVQM